MKIIRVEPVDPMTSLTWMIGSRCNYDCMYCPSELHDNTSSHPDINELKQSWLSFYHKTQHIGLPYKISFSGGEVTANRSFLPLVEFIRNGNFNIGQIVVTTNGSASENYYSKLADLVDAISFSTHSEFFDEQEFFNKARAINAQMPKPHKSFHVNIMNEFWNQERIGKYCSWLQTQGISYSINVIDYTKQIRLHPILKGTYNLD
jgi:MoaA/NifB/PqqE/SkfB family radical SAM enzyme